MMMSSFQPPGSATLLAITVSLDNGTDIGNVDANNAIGTINAQGCGPALA